MYIARKFNFEGDKLRTSAVINRRPEKELILAP